MCLSMLLNMYPQPSESICHCCERHTTIPGMWRLLNRDKIPIILSILIANKLRPWLACISVLTEVLSQGPPKLFCSSAREIEVREWLILHVCSEGLNCTGFIGFLARAVLKILMSSTNSFLIILPMTIFLSRDWILAMKWLKKYFIYTQN